MRTEPEANGFRAEFAVLRPRGVYVYVGGRKRQKNKKRLKNEENRRFSTSFPQNKHKNEREVLYFLQYLSFFYPVVPKCDSLFLNFYQLFIAAN